MHNGEVRSQSCHIIPVIKIQCESRIIPTGLQLLITTVAPSYETLLNLMEYINQNPKKKTKHDEMHPRRNTLTKHLIIFQQTYNPDDDTSIFAKSICYHLS